MDNTAKVKRVRAINDGPKSAPAQTRRKFYANAIDRIKTAIKEGYPLEAITLLESMMADRLEARLACISNQEAEKRKFSTLGRLSRELCGNASHESDDAKTVYEEVQEWASQRNESLHEMVKLAEGDAKDWKAKLKEAHSTAKDGLKLFRQLDVLVRKLNKKSTSFATATESRN